MSKLRMVGLALTGILALWGITGAGCAAPDGNESDMYTWTMTPPPSEPKLPKHDPKAFAIGAVLPLEGPLASAGLAIERGLQLAVAEVNAAGGVNGQPIQLDIVDTQGKPDTGLHLLNALRDRGVNVLLIGDGPLAVTSAAQLGGDPELVGFLSDYVAALQQTPKNGVRLYLNGDEEGRLIENYIDAAGITRVAVVYCTDELNDSHQRYLMYLFSGNHNIFTTDEGYSPTEQNFTLLGQAMQRMTTSALVVIGAGPEYRNIFSAFANPGWKGQTFGYAGLGDLKGLPANAAYPLPDFAVNPNSTDAGHAFATAFAAKYGVDATLPAAYAYDNIHALAAAAKAAGSTDMAKLRTALIGLGSYTGAAGRYDLKADGDSEMPLRLVQSDGTPLPPPVKPEAAPTTQEIKTVPKLNFSQP